MGRAGFTPGGTGAICRYREPCSTWHLQTVCDGDRSTDYGTEEGSGGMDRATSPWPPGSQCAAGPGPAPSPVLAGVTQARSVSSERLPM